MALAHEEPFEWLQALENLARERAKGLPRQEKVQQIWKGIAFRLENFHLLTPLTEIREVLNCPRSLAKVPGAKPWVRGIANIRGLLLPVVDLQACLGKKSIVLENRSRLLVLNQSGVSSGVLVDEVLGIKHFQEYTRKTDVSYPEEWLQAFGRGVFIQEDTQWIVLDMLALSKSRMFLDAAQ